MDFDIQRSPELEVAVGDLPPANSNGQPKAHDRLSRLAKSLYDQRRQREQFLPVELFGEPAWDILLLLYWARHSQRRMSVSAACAAAGVPPTTALRYLEHLCRSGLLSRERHPTDKRVFWVALSDKADSKIGTYLERIRNAPIASAQFC